MPKLNSMPHFLEDAREELKRADHLLYVSLKYTRTVDVIRSLIERLINSFEAVFSSLLDHALAKKLVSEKPSNIGLQAELIRKTFSDDQVIADMIAFYFSLKKIMRAEYRRSKEFRRHVTMTAITDSGVVEIDIDRIKEHYFKTKEYVEHCERVIYGERETDY